MAPSNVVMPPAQPVGTIEIFLTSDGKVQAKCQVPGRQMLLMMLETAKFDLERILHEREKQAAEQLIEMPTRGLLVG